MIRGVKIKKLKVWQDKPDVEPSKIKLGFLMEVLRSDEGLLSKFGQTTFTVTYKGTIKAFHWHKIQDDLWFIATGRAKIVLHDLRKKSKTYGETQVIKVCPQKKDYKLILIPKGVAHGYKVESSEPVLLFYHTTRPYNAKSPDEERIPFDSKVIGYEW